MKILVIGGSGLIGSKVVSNLRQLGYDVLVGSPSNGINIVTGEGLTDAVKGAQVVIDLSNSPSFEDQAVLDFFETSGRNLLAAEEQAGVKHHIALSVVGTDRMQESGYFRAKMAQENLIRQSKVPYTIVRSTQFFEFLGGIAQFGTVGNEIRLSPAHVQPISSDDIAAVVTDTALEQPINDSFDAAGPEKVGLAELMKRYLAALGDQRVVVSDPEAAYYGAQINDQSLTPIGEAKITTTGFSAWISKSQAAK
ncbi:NmrA family transcriptional regulator [Herminiimonas sp. KBW02]|uniref:SDR family oxidoreductase n=1 Tax=Herminiimonas sp. KBW02 TaxID=2153363 RepID=UPI000F59AD28|nr:SDR family oxidoreductase [Herminiimonas sp. KBW02]RQO33481.1 NmrA family transcriptional regulator [Herminiimonas sp. KBW02]